MNEKSKDVQLCGGKPKYDLTVMDFERWGMGGAIPRLRDPSDHGLLTRCLKWAKVVLGREHHAHWFKELDHPDARLIAAAPAMDLALQMLTLGVSRLEINGSLQEFCFNGIRYCLNGDWDALLNCIGWNEARAAIAQATGETP